MRLFVVEPPDERASRSVDLALRAIEPGEMKRVRIDRPWSRLDRESRRIERRFQHTPAPLIESWKVWRLLQRRTRPGDVVLMSDHAGLGGAFALSQAAAPTETRRVLWTVAADSAFLEMRLISGVHQGLPMPLDSQIDWEIAQYQWSDRVLATSKLAIEELARIGVDAEAAKVPDGQTAPARPVDVTRIWAPGPVSRRNQSGELLRAVTSIPGVTITMGDEDAPDLVWSGTSWDALKHSRSVLGDRVSRSPRPPADPGVVVWGDPYAAPDAELAALRDQGSPVVVPEKSATAMVWPDAPTWGNADDLVSALTGRTEQPATASIESPDVTPRANPSSSGDRVSVAIPIFRDVRFLPDCVDSILSQELEPMELLLIDDGSASEDVDQTLEELSGSDSRIRVIRTEHRGVCVARNVGLEQMQGDSFVFVDSDDLLLPTFLSACAAVLRSSAELWAVATWTEFFGAYEGIEAKSVFDARVGMRENPIVSTCVLVDMRVRDAGIRFAPDLAFLFCEDWHFWSQIVAAGGRFGLVPEPLARHRVHTSSGGFMRTEVAHSAGKTRATEPLRRLTDR